MTEARKYKVRDRRNKGWFYMDNDYLNGYAKIFGAVGTAIYVSLCRHADTDQKCFPSQETIGKELNIHQRTVIRYMKKFIEHRLIEVERERKDGVWVSNTYWLLDKTEWLPHDLKSHGDQVTLNAPSSDFKDQTQVTQSHTKKTKTKNTNEEEAPQSGAENAIPLIIDLFKEINPAYKKWYGNTTQRKAVAGLLESHGFEQLQKVIAIIPKTNKIAYMPTITTPLQLEDKWASLESGLIKEKNKISNNKREIIQ